MSITTAGDRLEVTHDSLDVPAPVVLDDPTDAKDATDRPDRPDRPDWGRGQGPDAVEVQASARPTFTITDAATACSVSRKTITRKLPELAGHGAAKDDDGVWRIPVEALLAVGLHPGRSLPEVAPSAARAPAPAPLPARPAEQDTVTIPRDRWDDVRIRLARAEAEAAERGFALADARLALRALTAGPIVSDRAAHPAPASRVTTPPERVMTSPADPPTTHDPSRVDGAPGADSSAASRSGQGADPRVAPVEAPDPRGATAADPGLAVAPADVVAARNLAARTGGYVPAGVTPVAKRRWWQSR